MQLADIEKPEYARRRKRRLCCYPDTQAHSHVAEQDTALQSSQDKAVIRKATELDLPAIKKIANQNRKFIGFVMWPVVLDSLR